MQTNRGLVKLILLIVLGILILGYFDISIRAILNSPTTQDNLTYVGKFVLYLWQTFFQPLAGYLYGIVTK